MDKRKAPATNKDLLRALTELLNEPEPGSPEEIDTVLREAGYDPDQIAAKIKAAAERGLQESPLNWRNRTQELDAAKNRLDMFASNVNRSRQELLSAIEAALNTLATKNPAVATVHHRNFENATNEDLASLLAELYYLTASYDKPPAEPSDKE